MCSWKQANKDIRSYSLKMYVWILLKDRRSLPTCVIKKQHKINQALTSGSEYVMFKLTFQFPSCFYGRMATRGFLHRRGYRKTRSDRVKVEFFLAFHLHLSDLPLQVNCWVCLAGEIYLKASYYRGGTEAWWHGLLHGLLPNHSVPVKCTTVHTSIWVPPPPDLRRIKYSALSNVGDLLLPLPEGV